ncbi:MAG: pilus assembly protein PilP [Chitinophagaceae bacterium]|nr:pilus assembly protein PilP [Oligoflexus sp.]
MKLTMKLLIIGICLLPLGGRSALAKSVEKKAKVTDLNQIDLEQVEDENWENKAASPQINPDRGMKIRDIIEPTSEYTYASFGKPDPFSMPISERPKDTGADKVSQVPIDMQVGNSKEITVVSPLQNYPMGSLKVMGIWQKADGEMRSVILTPKNESIVVKVGDPISSGKVLAIDKKEIVVRLYKIRKDGVRDYEDARVTFGTGSKVAHGTIKLEPGKEAQFPGMEKPADANPFKIDPAAAGGKAAGQGAPAPTPVAGAPAAAPPIGLNPPATGTPPGGAAPAAPALGWPYTTGAPAPAADQTPGRPGSSPR